MVASAHPAHAERIREVVEPAVASAGLVLEDVTVHHGAGRSVVEVVIDLTEDDEGDLDLDRVADATRAVSDALDAADAITGEYTLEVMSPGVSRPLTERRHFTRAAGHLVVVGLRDGTRVTGRLTAVQRAEVEPAGDAIVVVPMAPGPKGRKPVIGDPVRIPLSEVRTAHVEVDLAGLGPIDDDEAGTDAAAEQES
jgi:ribosome maturation factor RimP